MTSGVSVHIFAANSTLTSLLPTRFDCAARFDCGVRLDCGTQVDCGAHLDDTQVAFDEIMTSGNLSSEIDFRNLDLLDCSRRSALLERLTAVRGS